MSGPGETRAILFDLDGTLADSLGVMRHAYQLFLAAHARESSEAEFESLNGPPLAEVVRRLKVAHRLQDDEEILFSRYSKVVDQAYARVRPSPGAPELVEEARKRNCAMGVVTSNTRRRARAWLETVGLFDRVSVIVGGEDVENGKPHPEPYRRGCLQMPCDPTLIVAIEDSPQGARSARAAGLRTLVLSPSVQGWASGVEPINSLFDAAEKLWG